MRDWMIVIIVLLILGIVLDGIRRWRIAKREELRLSRNAAIADKEMSEERVASSEFPSGGARVARQRDQSDASSVNSNLRENYESSRVTLGARNRIPEQVALNLDEHVPMLMDSVEIESKENHEHGKHLEPTITEVENFEDLDREEELSAIEGEPEPESEKVTVQEESFAQEEPKIEEQAEEYVQPDEVLIFNVMARPDTRFYGPELMKTLMEQEMKLGEMDIFHRHANQDGCGPILFSLANMVVPGTFNLSAMDEFQTPGVSLFLSLPLPSSLEKASESASLDAYNLMSRTAQALAKDLDGELKDENRSVMTLQTIEHGRQRVIEYQRKRKLSKA